MRTLAAEAVGRPAEAAPAAQHAAEGAGQVLAVLPRGAAVPPQRTLVDVCNGNELQTPRCQHRGHALTSAFSTGNQKHLTANTFSYEIIRIPPEYNTPEYNTPELLSCLTKHGKCVWIRVCLCNFYQIKNRR